MIYISRKGFVSDRSVIDAVLDVMFEMDECPIARFEIKGVKMVALTRKFLGDLLFMCRSRNKILPSIVNNCSVVAKQVLSDVILPSL